MTGLFENLRAQVQSDLDSIHPGGSLELSCQEYPGPLTIHRSMTLEGHGATLWALKGPVLVIAAGAKVQLKNLRVEVTGEDMEMSPAEEVAISVAPGGEVELEDVEVRGTIEGLPMEAAGNWRYPKTLYLGQMTSSQEHEFRVRIATAASCKIASEVTGIEVFPSSLPGGPVELKIKVERLRNDTFLYGRILLKTGLSKRWIVVSGHVVDDPLAGPAPQASPPPMLWEPHDWATLATQTAPVPTPARPAPVAVSPPPPPTPVRPAPPPPPPAPVMAPPPAPPSPPAPAPVRPLPPVVVASNSPPAVKSPPLNQPLTIATTPLTQQPTSSVPSRPGLRHQDPNQLGIFGSKPGSAAPGSTPAPTAAPPSAAPPTSPVTSPPAPPTGNQPPSNPFSAPLTIASTSPPAGSSPPATPHALPKSVVNSIFSKTSSTVPKPDPPKPLVIEPAAPSPAATSPQAPANPFPGGTASPPVTRGSDQVPKWAFGNKPGSPFGQPKPGSTPPAASPPTTPAPATPTSQVAPPSQTLPAPPSPPVPPVAVVPPVVVAPSVPVSGPQPVIAIDPPVTAPTASAPVPIPAPPATFPTPVPKPPSTPFTSQPVTGSGSSKPNRGSPLQRSPARLSWRYRHNGATKVGILRNCPAVDAQGRLIAAMGRDLVALQPAADRCELVWSWTTGDVIPGSPVIGADGTIYVHSSDGFLHALTSEGKPLRAPTKVGPALGWATPLVDEQNRVWISASTGGLLRVDAVGQIADRPFLRYPKRFDSTGVILQGVLYIGCEDQFVHAISLEGDRGREQWNQREKVGETGWYINSALALTSRGIVIAISADNQLHGWKPDGTVAFTVALGGRAIGSPVIAEDDTIFVGLTRMAPNGSPAGGRLIGISGVAGQVAWQCDLPSAIESTPVISESGKIFVGDNNSEIHSVDIRSRKVEWTDWSGAPVRSAGLLLPTGDVVFGLDDGSLVALKADATTLSAGWPKLLKTTGNRVI